MAENATLPTHGASVLPSVEVDSYNLEVEDDDGFVGDKASNGAFRKMIESAREALRREGADPLGDTDTDEISKKKLETILAKGDADAAAVVQSAIESFAQSLAYVIKRFLRQKSWRDTEAIVFGGGFRGGRVGELAIARTRLLLREAEIATAVELIHNHPDEAGLIGAAHLLPPWMMRGHDAMLAVDVGGTNIRTGIVNLNLDKKSDLSKATVDDVSLWRHRDEENISREDAVGELTRMLRQHLKGSSKRGLAPVIGVGCPGLICEDGSIERGTQNLPGNWASSRFNLPKALKQAIPHIADEETMVVLHNDAVVQGLSERPHMADQERWAVLTIGTGLGNAHYTNRRPSKT